MGKKVVFPMFVVVFFAAYLFPQQAVKISDLLSNPQAYHAKTVVLTGVIAGTYEGDKEIARHYILRDASGTVRIFSKNPWLELGTRYSITASAEFEGVKGEIRLTESSYVPLEKSYKIKDILNNSYEYLNEVVKITGVAFEYEEARQKNTSFYKLKDDWGDIITVRTSRPAPVINTRYTVTGPVGIDPTAWPPNVYLSEETRESIDVIPPPPPKKWYEDIKNLLIAAIVVIFIIMVVVLVRYLRLKEAPETVHEFERPRETKEREKAPETIKLPEPEQVLEGDTIKMAMPPSGTLKMLPGRLIVLEGDKIVKEIRFYKTKSEEENEITFGRAAGKPYTHIQLKEMTVSARHAKLIYAGKRFTLINYSKTNATRVNDVELEENGMTELKDGDRIQMGEVIFGFHTH